MIDLQERFSNVKKFLTPEEYTEKYARNEFNIGDVVYILDEGGCPRITEVKFVSPIHWERDTIKKFQEENWQDKHSIKVFYKNHSETTWAYMKENNIIPKDIAEEIEAEVKEEEKRNNEILVKGEKSYVK